MLVVVRESHIPILTPSKDPASQTHSITQLLPKRTSPSSGIFPLIPKLRPPA